MSEMLYVVSWVCNLFSASVINVEFYLCCFQLLRKMHFNDTEITVNRYIINMFILLYNLSSAKQF